MYSYTYLILLCLHGGGICNYTLQSVEFHFGQVREGWFDTRGWREGGEKAQAWLPPKSPSWCKCPHPGGEEWLKMRVWGWDPYTLWENQTSRTVWLPVSFRMCNGVPFVKVEIRGERDPSPLQVRLPPSCHLHIDSQHEGAIHTVAAISCKGGDRSTGWHIV